MLTYGTLLLVLNCIARWKLFEKAGEQGWKALIPYYNSYIYCKLADCVRLFIAELILSVTIQMMLFLAYIKSLIWALYSFGSMEMEFDYDDIWDILYSSWGASMGIFVITILSIMAALAVIRIFINLKFVKCYSEDTVFKVLAGIGSIQPFYVLLVIARSILAFDKKYSYHDPRVQGNQTGHEDYSA